MAIDIDQPLSTGDGVRAWWRIIAAVLVLDIFLQAVFAGAMLSGYDWARAAHAGNGVVVVAATFLAGLAATVTLRRIPNGWRLALVLLALAATVLVQFALGSMAAKGANLMWLHVPLGVTLVGLAGQAVAGARKLGEGA
jgi:hypothetical protein